MTDLAALRAAILKALPVDWDDRTTVVEVVPDDGRGHPVTVWGHPERLADAILAAIQPMLDEGITYEWAARCVNPKCNHADDTGIFHVRDKRDSVEKFVAGGKDPDWFELVQRKRGPWEAVD